ncbi:aminotransferase class I/II-fold pyridoxal phosphate-dependent enzyme, partial [bacterium]|nr:aminotransferase class I/II-fold pyridoxal phosphate-dependent enzyme [bacterium]
NKYILENGINTYSTPKGELYFRNECAKYMKRRFSAELDPNTEIFSLIGSKEGIANLIRAIINPTTIKDDQDIILVPDPGYASYKEMVKVSGGNPYPIALNKQNNYMPDIEEVINKIQKEGYTIRQIKALIINYPNNPIGAIANLEYYEKLVSICKKHQILLISDAAYADISLKPEIKPHSIFEISGAKDIAVEFFSFSKPYAMTGWRLGWICGNKDVIKSFGKLKSVLDSGIFKAIQKIGADLLNSKEGDDYIVASNEALKRNQELFVNGLRELGWKNFDIPDATFYLWLPIPPRYKNSKDFTDELMHKSGIITVPGDAYGDNGKGFFRVSIVCSEEEIKEVLLRMKKDGFVYN